MGIASVLGKPERVRYPTLSAWRRKEEAWSSPRRSESGPAKRMLLGHGSVDEFERARKTRRCLDANGVHGSQLFSSSSGRYGGPHHTDTGWEQQNRDQR